MLNFAHPCHRKVDLICSFRCSFSHGVRKLPEVAESIFHQNIINMLVSGDKGPFEKCRIVFFCDFDANCRTISKFEKNFLSKFTSFFKNSLLSIRYVIRIGSADFEHLSTIYVQI